MKQDSMIEIIQEQTIRALWEVRNVIDCVPDELWNREYCGMPCWKHIYHMLHSPSAGTGRSHSWRKENGAARRSKSRIKRVLSEK